MENEYMANCIVNIYTRHGNMGGIGFAIDKQHIITCAHVIAGTTYFTEDELKDVNIKITPALIDNYEQIDSKVVFTIYDRSRIDKDIAVLNVDKLPIGVVPAKVGYCVDYSREIFTTYGCPSGQIIIEDRIRIQGKIADGCLQGKTMNIPANPIRNGFSGSPVIGRGLSAVIGMIAQADPQYGICAIIPTNKLKENYQYIPVEVEELGMRFQPVYIRGNYFYIAESLVSEAVWGNIMNCGNGGHPDIAKVDLSIDDIKDFIENCNRHLFGRGQIDFPTMEHLGILLAVGDMISACRMNEPRLRTNPANIFGIYDLIGVAWQICKGANNSFYKWGGSFRTTPRPERNNVPYDNCNNTLFRGSEYGFRPILYIN